MIGYTGTNFDRPGFIRLKEDIEDNKINLVITKDLSRLGREYIETGYYLEKYFPAKNVRYIALNDGIDTANKNNGNNDMGAFKSVVNDMYAKDISKKVRTAKRTKAEKGEFIGAFAPYGYMKHPDDITKLVIDEEVVDNVKYIFNEYVKGNGLAYIARRLNEKNIECPSVYKQRTCKFHCKTTTGLWGHATVRSILVNKVYTGDLIQRQGETISYKVKKYRLLPKSEHAITPNAHEPIIDKATFDLAQDILKKKAHAIHRKEGTKHLLSGLIYCPRCSQKYTFQLQSGLKDDMVAVCSSYNRYGKDYCSRIAVRESILEEYVSGDLKAIVKEKLDKEELVNSIDITKVNNNKNKLQKKIFDNNRRLEEITRVIKTSYEDRVNGLLDADEFRTFTEDYRKEKEKLLEENQSLKEKLEDKENGKEAEVIKYIKQIAGLENIDRSIVLNLIDKIEILDRENIRINYKFAM